MSLATDLCCCCRGNGRLRGLDGARGGPGAGSAGASRHQDRARPRATTDHGGPSRSALGAMACRHRRSPDADTQGDLLHPLEADQPRVPFHQGGNPRKLVGPSSPIGDRYLGFHRGDRGEFGIHGTPWPHWVRTRAAVSLGCVRMLNAHIRELFDVVEVGTPLQIQG